MDEKRKVAETEVLDWIIKNPIPSYVEEEQMLLGREEAFEALQFSLSRNMLNISNMDMAQVMLVKAYGFRGMGKTAISKAAASLKYNEEPVVFVSIDLADSLLLRTTEDFVSRHFGLELFARLFYGTQFSKLLKDFPLFRKPATQLYLYFHNVLSLYSTHIRKNKLTALVLHLDQINVLHKDSYSHLLCPLSLGGKFGSPAVPLPTLDFENSCKLALHNTGLHDNTVKALLLDKSFRHLVHSTSGIPGLLVGIQAGVSYCKKALNENEEITAELISSVINFALSAVHSSFKIDTWSKFYENEREFLMFLWWCLRGKLFRTTKNDICGYFPHARSHVYGLGCDLIDADIINCLGTRITFNDLDVAGVLFLIDRECYLPYLLFKLFGSTFEDDVFFDILTTPAGPLYWQEFADFEAHFLSILLQSYNAVGIPMAKLSEIWTGAWGHDSTINLKVEIPAPNDIAVSQGCIDNNQLIDCHHMWSSAAQRVLIVEQLKLSRSTNVRLSEISHWYSRTVKPIGESKWAKDNDIHLVVGIFFCTGVDFEFTDKREFLESHPNLLVLEADGQRSYLSPLFIPVLGEHPLLHPRKCYL